MADAYVWTPLTIISAAVTSGSSWSGTESRDVDELRRRAAADVAWFWDAMVAEIGVEFFEPYHPVLDSSEGIAWSRWFVGGKLNLAHNCPGPPCGFPRVRRRPL